MMTPSDYLTLFDSAVVTYNPRKQQVLRSVCRIAIMQASIYKSVELQTQIPWQAIAAIHFRESNQNFRCHLHNGDPLTAKTLHVPSGRPLAGSPPFAWQTSAIDALGLKWKPERWDLASTLSFLEHYNGTGYQKHGINTPYLWDWTDHYTSGLYVSDGHFDPSAQEDRPGCVPILLGLGYGAKLTSIN